MQRMLLVFLFDLLGPFADFGLFPARDKDVFFPSLPLDLWRFRSELLPDFFPFHDCWRGAPRICHAVCALIFPLESSLFILFFSRSASWITPFFLSANCLFSPLPFCPRPLFHGKRKRTSLLLIPFISEKAFGGLFDFTCDGTSSSIPSPPLQHTFPPRNKITPLPPCFFEFPLRMHSSPLNGFLQYQPFFFLTQQSPLRLFGSIPERFSFCSPVTFVFSAFDTFFRVIHYRKTFSKIWFLSVLRSSPHPPNSTDCHPSSLREINLPAPGKEFITSQFLRKPFKCRRRMSPESLSPA